MKNAGSKEKFNEMITIQWNSYRDQVIPKDAGKTQVDECYKAFVAGAATQATILGVAVSSAMDALGLLADEIANGSPSVTKRAHGEEV